ncbi:MAG: OmpA family protein [Prolixibacteraceae bacterium]|nr:OmpA family protein [Burkholderiales bacterium]
MRLTTIVSAGLLMLSSSPVIALDLEKLPKIGEITNKSLLDNVNQSLAKQQINDGQFEFKTGKAEFAPGNDKRVKGLLKVLTEHSKRLKGAFPNLHVTAEGHTDSDGSAQTNQKLSLARANKVCAELKSKGMKLPCTPIGAGSGKPLASPEKSAADKQKNRRVLVQVAK